MNYLHETFIHVDAALKDGQEISISWYTEDASQDYALTAEAALAMASSAFMLSSEVSMGKWDRSGLLCWDWGEKMQ